MVKFRKLINKFETKRLLAAQIGFTFFAFATMVFLGYVFIGNTVHVNLIKHTESVIDFIQTQFDDSISDHKIPLEFFALHVRELFKDVTDIDELQEHFNEMSDYMNEHEHYYRCFSGFIGYFETLPGGAAFLSGTEGEYDDNFIATDHSWYRAAIEANGQIAQTILVDELIDGEATLAYSMILFDDDGKYLGVICLRVKISAIGRDPIAMALNKGGYGLLLNSDYEILAHLNPEYIGKKATDINSTFIPIIDTLKAGNEVAEMEMTNYLGEPSIAFFRKINNGWYLGLITPSQPFYEPVRLSLIFLITLGAILAIILVIILIQIDTVNNKLGMESKYKSAFLANMSHEIRTPMNAIIGMTIIGKAAVSTERKDYCLTKIEDAGQHLLGILNDVLDMSKIEANKFELFENEFNFEKILQRSVNVVNFRIEEKKQHFTVYIDPDIPKVLIGDEQHLAQVVTNLLGNAVKFTPENGMIGLDAMLLKNEDDFFVIQISISDTGIGINNEHQAKLFQSFHQAESSTSRKFGGTGLGLAISKSLIELMGGEIWVNSEPGKGSIFFFTFRMKQGTKKENILAPEVNWDNTRILVIDDDLDTLIYFRELSNEIDISCDIASSVEEALELVKENDPYSIYFVDWQMPGMNGIDIINILKKETDNHSSKLIMMISATEWSFIEEETKPAGIDMFLAKPLFPSMIADAINEALDMNKNQAAVDKRNINGLFSGYHFLLTEDVDINREIVKALLEDTLVEIECAENGIIATQMFEAAPDKYDLILMDIQMPEMDGYDATRYIRALDIAKAKEIPIIAMTANVFREDIEKCLMAGMNGHIGKPLDFDEVIEKLCFYLTKGL